MIKAVINHKSFEKMADSESNSGQPPNEDDSLESPAPSLENDENALDNAAPRPPEAADAGGPVVPEPGSEAAPPPPDGKRRRFSLRQLRQRLNIYLLLFGAVLLLAGMVIIIAFLENRHTTPNNQLQTQGLSKSTLEQLANSDATVGNSHSVLNVQSSAVFAGQVLVRQDLDVAGNLQIGGTVALSAITVSGASQFGQATINKNLTVGGDAALQGALTIAKSLQVNGNGNFSGTVAAPQITASRLQLNGDLVLAHHVNTVGALPGRSGGSALGSGGSVSISGDDTAGSISINTGSGAAAGCFVTINFTSPYAGTPHVMVTPIGAAAGGLSYYVNRSTANFSICDAAAPPGGSSFGFDYFVID